MNSRRATLLDLLAWDERAKFIIPRWQRQYVWGTTGAGGREIEQLWQDLRTNCVDSKKHFCGVMLLRKMDNEPVLSWEIVDGQQRMTTFFLLFIAVRDECEKRGILFPELNSVFTTGNSEECRLVLLQGLNDDRHVMNALLLHQGGELEQKIKDESRIYKTYLWFVNQLVAEIPDKGMGDFVLSVLQGVDLLILTVDPSDDTRRIFETLNSRGKHIDPDDLVANLINFIGNTNQEVNERAQQVWYHVTKTFDRDDLGSFLDTFGKRNAQQTARGTIFEEIKFEVEEAQQQGKVDLWLREFERAAKNYVEILFPDDSNDPIQVLLFEIRRLRTQKLDPFLLALLEAFRDTPASEPLIHNVRSLVVRLLVCHERPAYKLEHFAELACYAFYDSGVSKTERLERVIKLIDAHWVDDGTFGRAFTTRSFYAPGAHISRLRYYLEKLEQKIAEDSGQPFEMHFGTKTTIEHVMPQSLNQVWISSLRTANTVRLEAQHTALMDTIGNLTVLLVGDNSAVKNACFAEKKQFYLSPNETLQKLGLRKRSAVIGTCALNRYFENVTHWNFQAIAERSQHLASLGLQIWNKQDWNREIE